MADDTKLREQVDRGERAALVLKELDEAFEALEKQCFEVFRHSDMHDDAGRKAARYYLRVMDDIRERFRTAVVSGKNAHGELVRMKPESMLKKVING